MKGNFCYHNKLHLLRLHSWLNFFCVVVGLFEAQPFEGEAGTSETRCDLFFGVVIGEDDDLNARTLREQGRDDVALQEIDDCHAVVGRDENAFGH